MASETHMPGPVCFIENTNGQLMVNQEALEILSSITQPMVVVAIVGLYRTGKSYLMNKLAGKQKGFSLGSTVQSHTKGIWMWCVPHPRKPDHTLVLLDTEGLGDVKKSDNQNDCWIFALAVLLSSTFVYNSNGTINQYAMDQLHYVTELTKRIRAKSSPEENEVEDSAYFVSFFPDFVWTLRDVTLKLEADGQPLTADEYLENSLRLKQGTSDEEENYNLPRLCIRKFFPKKKCFVFYPPTEWKKLSQLETLHDDELDPDFLQQVEEFCSYIFKNSRAKTLSGGIKVNGPRLKSLVVTYVNAISSGDLPCMENAVLALAQTENAAAVQKAIAHYDQQMGQRMQLPTDTLQELLDLHTACEREATKIFIWSSFKDVDHLFQKQLVTQLEHRWDYFCNQNLEASSDLCCSLLQNIFGSLEEEVNQGLYSKPGGYLLFIDKTEELKKTYLQEPRKGIQAEEVLQKYLKSKEPVTYTILYSDQTLTEKQKEIEVEHVKAQSAQAEAKMLEEKQKKYEQLMEQKEKSHQEYIKQLAEKMEQDIAQLRAEQERIITLKLREQERLLKEGIINESIKLKKEIQDMEMRNREKVEHEKAESAQATATLLEEMQKMKQHVMELTGDSHGEYVKQWTQKVENRGALKCQITVASGPMTAPMCLVENKDKQLSVNPEAVQILEAISQPVVVVAIVGLYRTGKSYLMNCLSGQNHGFPLGSTVKSETKGIWMWCVPHPCKPNHTLVLLDTEGLGDVEKGDPKNDSWIFTLAILLSSTFIYNSMSTINNDALEKLRYVTELTELIRAKSSPRSDGIEDSTDFVSFFPDFIWTVRDFTLELKLDGRTITEDEYLENALKFIPENSPQVHHVSNQSRECIKYFFPRRKCFVFDRPVNDTRLLSCIEFVSENQLNPEFQKKSRNFCSHIFAHANTKKFREGIVVTGNYLGTLVQTYVNAINSGAVPCLENAVTTLAQRENSAAVQKAAKHYSEQMAQRVRLPTDTLQELLDVHAACEREALAVFMEHSFKDENREFQKKLVESIEKKKEEFMLQNEEASVKYCQAQMEQLSEPLMESLSRGAFSVSGGHRLYLEAKKKVEHGYELVPRKGVKATEVLQSFLQSQAAIEEIILQSDKALTGAEKATAAELAMKEAVEKKQELLRQQHEEQEQLMKARERSLLENIKQLKEKMERERENILREQERILTHRLKVQEELLTQDYKEKYEKLNKEVNLRRKEIEITKDKRSLALSRILNSAGDMFITVLPGVSKIWGVGMKILSLHIQQTQNSC